MTMGHSVVETFYLFVWRLVSVISYYFMLLLLSFLLFVVVIYFFFFLQNFVNCNHQMR